MRPGGWIGVSQRFGLVRAVLTGPLAPGWNRAGCHRPGSNRACWFRRDAVAGRIIRDRPAYALTVALPPGWRTDGYRGPPDTAYLRRQHRVRGTEQRISAPTETGDGARRFARRHERDPVTVRGGARAAYRPYNSRSPDSASNSQTFSARTFTGTDSTPSPISPWVVTAVSSWPSARR